jgi:predicted glycosyltransferase
MRIWFDIMNTPQVHFLLSIKSMLEEDNSFIFTAREFSETAKLLESKLDAPFETIGEHHGKKYVSKIAGTLHRFLQVHRKRLPYDLSISNGSENAIWSSFLRGKKSIAFGDNDTARQWTYARFCNYAFFPNAIDKSLLNKQGLHDGKLYRYNGFKEDLYLANYIPSPTFREQLPFENYVVVRPENIMANYIRNNEVKSITPELLKLLNRKGFNILYLPRYEFDKNYAKGISNLYIPEKPINGLDACYYSDAVLTGAGTFAREAACLGVPSISFFAGKTLLAVDQRMIKEDWMYFSRQPHEILSFVLKSSKRDPDLNRSKVVYDEVKDKLLQIIQSFEIN